jgi:hypothetical protein
METSTKAFDAIKQAIQKDCIMHYYNPNKEPCSQWMQAQWGLGQFYQMLTHKVTFITV